MAEVAIERRRAGDADELFRLYAEVFGQALTESSRKRWQWQYLQNPHTTSAGPEIWVAREGEGVLGQYASMPVVLWWGGREVRSSWGMDVFLRPEARGKGVGARLFTTWSDHVEVALGLGLTPSSYGLFKKLRYADVGPVPFFQKVLDARAVSARRLGPVLGTLLAPGLRAALALRHPERPLADARAVEVRPVAGFSDEYDALWEATRAGHAMCVRRDAAYLRWKFVDCPHARYDLLEARRGGALCGFAIGRVAEHEGLRLGWVLDLYAAADDEAARDALLQAQLVAFRRAGVARVEAFAMHAALQASLRRRGFMPGRSPMQFCVRTRVEDAPLRDLGRWHVVFGDSDMDRA